jgi:hypothetical protein
VNGPRTEDVRPLSAMVMTLQYERGLCPTETASTPSRVPAPPRPRLRRPPAWRTCRASGRSRHPPAVLRGAGPGEAGGFAATTVAAYRLPIRQKPPDLRAVRARHPACGAMSAKRPISFRSTPSQLATVPNRAGYFPAIQSRPHLVNVKDPIVGDKSDAVRPQHQIARSNAPVEGG